MEEQYTARSLEQLECQAVRDPRGGAGATGCSQAAGASEMEPGVGAERSPEAGQLEVSREL